MCFAGAPVVARGFCTGGEEADQMTWLINKRNGRPQITPIGWRGMATNHIRLGH